MTVSSLERVSAPIVTSVARSAEIGRTKYTNWGVANQKYSRSCAALVWPLNSLSERSMKVEM